MSPQDSVRTVNRCNGGNSVANPNLVYQDTSNVDPTTQTSFWNTQTAASDSPPRESAQHGGEAKTDGLSSITEYYRKQGFSKHITGVLLDSWRSGTQKQYAIYLKRWNVFCSERLIDPYSPNLNQVLEFVHTQLHLSY